MPDSTTGSPVKRLAVVVLVCALAGVTAAWALPEVLAAVEWPTFVSKTWLERMRAQQEQTADQPLPDVERAVARPVPSPKSQPSEAADRPAPRAPEPDSRDERAGDEAQPDARAKRPRPDPEPDEQPADAGPTDVTYKVDRRAVAAMIKNPTDLGKHGRFVPNTVDGQRRGFKFVDVAAGGLFDRLGIREGDVLLEVNGRALTTQAKLIEDIETLKSAQVYVVRIQRGDATRIHRYDAGPPLQRKPGGEQSQ